VLSMGNIGLSQGLPTFVRAFEDSDALEGVAARLVIAGDGVEAPAVRSAASGRRVEVMGLLSQAELDLELGRAALGVVTQRPELTEFNVPSKLMNYLAWGVPVVAAVRTDSEVAAIVRSSGAGWVTDARMPEAFPEAVSHALSDREELSRRGAAGRRFAEDRLTPERVAERFEDVLLDAVARSR
jgi:colanic acid biosynthesis glycosyl transferase WcaI